MRRAVRVTFPRGSGVPSQRSPPGGSPQGSPGTSSSAPSLGGGSSPARASTTSFSRNERYNTLGVPFVNFLGATDDGHGHWINGLGIGDGLHPNDAGHYEMFLEIVPSVFDAVKAGKPTPQWGNRSRFVRILGDPTQSAPLSFTPVARP